MTIERTISDWIYKYNSAENKFEVIPNIKIQKPKTLFKYFSMETHHIETLKHLYLWAAHPDTYNDLYDCYYNVQNFHPEFMIHYMSNYQRLEIVKANYAKNPKSFTEGFKHFFRADIFRKYGLVSFSETVSNILLWSYYNKNKGFAIEFDYSLFPSNFHGPFFMNYRADYNNELSIESEKEVPLMLLYISTIKNKQWIHEREWRVIVESPKDKIMFAPKIQQLKDLGGHDRKFDYPFEAIKSVALANYFFEIEEIYWPNDKILCITLLEEVDKKSTILNFLVEREIKTKIITKETKKGNSFDLDFREGFITKTGNNKYLFEAID